MAGSENGSESITKFLGSAAAILVALSAGAITGVLSRVARDERWLLGAAVVCALMASVFWSLGALRPDLTPAEELTEADRAHRERYKERRFGLAGLFFLVAFLSLAFAILLSQGIQGTPSINASLKLGPPAVLHASVHQAGLPTGSSLRVTVTASRGTASDPAATSTLYAANIGPNADGDANLSFTVPLTTTKYTQLAVAAAVNHSESCSSTSLPDVTGCVLLNLPPQKPKK